MAKIASLDANGQSRPKPRASGVALLGRAFGDRARPWTAAALHPLAARAAWALSLPAIIAIAAAVRLSHTLREPFPLNDGGLFLTMVRDIQAAGYALPEYTRYNGGDIPFAYPPLSMYLAALLDPLVPGSLETLFRVLPFAGSVLVVWAFSRLARMVLPGRITPLLATLAIALAPASYVWLLMGGGLSRSFGLAFALLALAEAWVLLRGDGLSRRRMATTGALLALTAVTHLEAAAFVGMTFVLMAAGSPRRGGLRLFGASVLAAVAAAPWWGLVMARHGVWPFIAARGEGGRFIEDGNVSLGWIEYVLRNPLFTGEPNFPIIGVLAVAGTAWSLAQRQWFLPAWWLTTMVVGMRAFPTFTAVPICLLAGVALGQVVGPALAHARRQGWQRPASIALPAVAAAVFTIGVLGARSSGPALADLRTLPEDDRAAMAWVAAETESGATFAVIPAHSWWADAASEWFPTLGERRSVATPHGYEWVRGEFQHREWLHWRLSRCAGSDVDCIELALAKGKAAATHVYVPAGCCEAVKESLRSSGEYEVLYDRDALVVRRSEQSLVTSQDAGEGSGR